MRLLFWFSLFGLLLFELANVYFIMPMPGSQQFDSLPVAYFLYTKRWWFRIILFAGLMACWYGASFKKKWVPLLGIVPVGVILYIVNFQMAADRMFRPVETLKMATAAENKVDSNRLVVGVSIGNEARAYPIRLIGYHHFVEDSIGGNPILVTYCTVCRTGRVFDPHVDGKHEHFRLVGMDHFNAMIEDATTKSWWQQATGEAVTGSLQGKKLKEIISTQTTLAAWLKMKPHSLVMQPDPAFNNKYDTSLKYEEGLSRKKLTGTDTLSWKSKSWIIGIERGHLARAYDWNQLKKQRLIEDTLNGQKIIIVLAEDQKSFFAFKSPVTKEPIHIVGDTLFSGPQKYLVNGKSFAGSADLELIIAYQEFWHSWKNFHPYTGTWPASAEK
jgi:hypothetical protein